MHQRHSKIALILALRRTTFDTAPHRIICRYAPRVSPLCSGGDSATQRALLRCAPDIVLHCIGGDAAA